MQSDFPDDAKMDSAEVHPLTQAIRRTTAKPDAIVGAGRLVSTVWSVGDERMGWAHRFNVYRMSHRNGRVSQLLRPEDLPDLVKLCQVLAATLGNDACIPADERRLLVKLAARLDRITRTES